MVRVAELAPVVGVLAACEALGVARASYYRHERRRRARSVPLPAPSPRNEGAAGERSELSAPGASAAVAPPVPPPATATTSAPTTLARVHPRALSPAERAAMLEILHSPRFQGAAPATVYATLLDE